MCLDLGVRRMIIVLGGGGVGGGVGVGGLGGGGGAGAEVGLGRDCGAAAGQLLRSGRMGSCSNSNDGGGKARNG